MLNSALLLFEETQTQNNNWMTLVMLIVVLGAFAAMMFFSGRSKKKREKELQEKLKVGSWVLTNSGVIGVVTELGDSYAIISTGKEDNPSSMCFHSSTIYQVYDKPPFFVNKSGEEESEPVYNEIK